MPAATASASGGDRQCLQRRRAWVGSGFVRSGTVGWVPFGRVRLGPRSGRPTAYLCKWTCEQYFFLRGRLALQPRSSRTRVCGVLLRFGSERPGSPPKSQVAMDTLSKSRINANLRRMAEHGVDWRNPLHVSAYLLARQQTDRPKPEQILAIAKQSQVNMSDGTRLSIEFYLVPRTNFLDRCPHLAPGLLGNGEGTTRDPHSSRAHGFVGRVDRRPVLRLETLGQACGEARFRAEFLAPFRGAVGGRRGSCAGDAERVC